MMCMSGGRKGEIQYYFLSMCVCPTLALILSLSHLILEEAGSSCADVLRYLPYFSKPFSQTP